MPEFIQAGDPDAGAGLQRLINAMSATGFVGYIPKGSWTIGCNNDGNGTATVTIPANSSPFPLQLYGAGHGVSILKWSSGCATASLFNSASSAGSHNINGTSMSWPSRRDLTFQGFSVYGDFMEGDSGNNNTPFVQTSVDVFSLWTIYKLTMRDIELYDNPYFGIVIRQGFDATCDHCIIRNNGRDGISVGAGGSMTVTNSMFEHDGDDAISIIQDGSAWPVGRFVIEGNTFIDTQGINGGCAPDTVIQGNTFWLTRFYPYYTSCSVFLTELHLNISNNIYAGDIDRSGGATWYSTTATVAPAVGNTTLTLSSVANAAVGDIITSYYSLPASTTITAINGNVVSLSAAVKWAGTIGQTVSMTPTVSSAIDALNGNIGIRLASKANAGAANAAPFLNDTTTGLIVNPIASNYAHGSAAGTYASAGNADIIISGNKLTQPFNTGVSYSSYGYGYMFTQNGWLNPTMLPGSFDAASATAGAAIDIATPTYNAIISNNVLDGFGSCLLVEFTFRGSFAGNTCTNFGGAGVYLYAAAAGRLAVSGNDFNGDPFLISSNRPSASSDTWTSSAASPFAVYSTNAWSATAAILSFHDNVISNVTAPFNTTTPVWRLA